MVFLTMSRYTYNYIIHLAHLTFTEVEFYSQHYLFSVHTKMMAADEAILEP